mgnify:CR=1 FL=1
MTAELKERIVDVAIEEFTLMGLKFTMNDIARQLGISKKTIYTILTARKMCWRGLPTGIQRIFAACRRTSRRTEA